MRFICPCENWKYQNGKSKTLHTRVINNCFKIPFRFQKIAGINHVENNNKSRRKQCFFSTTIVGFFQVHFEYLSHVYWIPTCIMNETNINFFWRCFPRIDMTHKFDSCLSISLRYCNLKFFWNVPIYNVDASYLPLCIKISLKLLDHFNLCYFWEEGRDKRNFS